MHAGWSSRFATGVQMPSEVANRLGEAFFSTKDGGTGIGLLLANATLERLGGQVSLSRDPRRNLYPYRFA